MFWSQSPFGGGERGLPMKGSGNGGPWLRELAVTEGTWTPEDLHRNFYEG